MDKKEYDEYSEPEAVATVIMKTNYLEKLLELKISNYFDIQNPEKKRIFEDLFLNNSLFSLGSKIKFCIGIDLIDEKKAKNFGNDFHTLISYRNSFAHQNLIISTTFESEELKKEGKKTFLKINNPIKSTHLIPLVNSKGNLSYQEAKILFSKFISLYDKIEKELE